MTESQHPRYPSVRLKAERALSFILLTGIMTVQEKGALRPSELTVALLWDCLCDTIRTLFLCVAENGEWGAGSGSELRTGEAEERRSDCWQRERLWLGTPAPETCLELRSESDLGVGRGRNACTSMLVPASFLANQPRDFGCGVVNTNHPRPTPGKSHWIARLVSQSLPSCCYLCLLSDGIRGMHHQTQLQHFILK